MYRMRYRKGYIDPGHSFRLVTAFALFVRLVQFWVSQLDVILFEVFLLRLGAESSVYFLIEDISQLDFAVVSYLFVRQSSQGRSVNILSVRLEDLGRHG